MPVQSHAEPLTDRRTAEALIDATIKQSLASDPGAAGVTRYARLPVGINAKAKYAKDGKPFTVKLSRWNPERRYTVDEIVEAFDLDLSAVEPPKRSNGKWTGPTEDRLAGWLAENGYLQGQPNSDGYISMCCPWIDEHTDRAATGTYYRPPQGDDAPGFKCHHGHCEGRTIRDVIQWAKTQGYESPRPPAPPPEAYEDDPALQASNDPTEPKPMTAPNPDEWRTPIPLPEPGAKGIDAEYPVHALPEALQDAVKKYHAL